MSYMSEAVALFDSVTGGLLDSFSATIDQIFTTFECNAHAAEITEHIVDESLFTALAPLAKVNSDYEKMIKTLTQLASANPAAIVVHLCGKFRGDWSRAIDSGAGATIPVRAVGFRATFMPHFQFSRHLSLVFLTDLVYAVFSEFPVEQPCSKLVSCAYSLCDPGQKFLRDFHL